MGGMQTQVTVFHHPELFAKIVVTALAGIAALAIIGYGGWRGYKFIRDKKRGYV